MCSVSQIEVPGPNGPLHITSQQEVEQHLSEALALHFKLTAQQPTPPSWLTPSAMSWASLGPPWLLELSYMAPTNAHQQLTFTPSSSLLPYRFPNNQLLSPWELSTMTSSTTGDGPRNELPRPTLGSTMATTRQLSIAPKLQSSMH